MIHYPTAKGLVEIHELQTPQEMTAAEQIQLQVWGAITPHPKEILIPIQHEGGLLAGAFSEQAEMIGLLFGFPTRDPAVQHSQMLATLPAWRGLGIGARMKWYQRGWCLERGINRVRWTVDPLRAANAELNIRHLGGTSAAYYPDYYGVMQGIDAGAPTDRLLVEWPLGSPRVGQRAGLTPADAGFPHAEPALTISAGRPGEPRFDLTGSAIRIAIPADFVAISQSDPALAFEWRACTRALFLHYFAAGYTITEFTRVNGPAYLLEKGALNDNGD